MGKKGLLIFVKNAELGKTKTRVAQTVGDELALGTYKFLLKHTQKIIHSLKSIDRILFYSDRILSKGDLFVDAEYQKQVQR